MNKHTPGPWFLSEYCDNPENFRAVSAYGHSELATVVWKMEDDERSPECEANARLIAAAPELLEALEGVIRVADRATIEFDAARAAIAKAKGEQTK